MALTVHDWLHRAQEAADPAEADRCLDAAEALALRGYEVRALLTAIADLRPIRRHRLTLA